jgi:hypothetical protein
VNASKPARLGRIAPAAPVSRQNIPQSHFVTHRAFQARPATFTGLRSSCPPPACFCSRFAALVKNKTAGHGGTGKEKMLVSANANNRILYAQQHIRRMRGGSQSHLMQASDGRYWIVKFQNNPQHIRVLANEFLASRIGRCLGLPIPEVQVIEVSDWLIQNTSELCVDCAGLKTRCCSGLQLACRYVANSECDVVFDYLPESMLTNIDNLNMFAACLVLDKWTCNVDGRQAVFTRLSQHRAFSAWLIESGKRASLLALSPLRTGRESFPSSGSSRS